MGYSGFSQVTQVLHQLYCSRNTDTQNDEPEAFGILICLHNHQNKIALHLVEFLETSLYYCILILHTH